MMNPTNLAAIGPALLASAIGEQPSSTGPNDQSPRTDALDDGPLTRDTVFDILRNERRRRVLHHLREHEESTLAALSEHIAAIENDVDESMVSSDQRKRVYVALYQCHLPRLDDANVVDYDRRAGTVRPGVRAPQLYPYLDLTPLDAGDDGMIDAVANADGKMGGAFLPFAIVVAGLGGFGLASAVPLDAVSAESVAVLTLVPLLAASTHAALRRKR